MRRSFPVAAVVVFALAGPAAAEPADSEPAELETLDACGLEDPAIAESAPEVAAKPGSGQISFADAPSAVRRVRDDRVLAGAGSHGNLGGALEGKTVYVSPGHGWTYVAGTGWRTQRGNTNSIVEDFVSVEAAGYYLIRMLQNMGAHVVPVRETDPNPNQSIVDDTDAGFAIAGVTLDDGGTGFSELAGPITDQSNPFRSGSHQVLTTEETATGEVSWTFDVAETGAYNVYVGYVQDPSRAGDAHYVVRHAGGETHFRVDQRRHGQTWVLLGRFFFEAGTSPEYGSLALLNDSATPDATLSADVARIGGGVNVIDRGGGASGFPMFETGARYYAQMAGAPSSVWDYAGADSKDDVGTRSRYAAWDHEAGEDAVYIAWHTNAFNGSTFGTETFAYGPSGYGPASDFSGVPGGVELMNAVHGELIGDVRSAWDSGWVDRGRHSAYFGEINPSHNPEMPSILAEIAFHDNASEASALRQPRFRYIAARAMAQGVARYFATRDGASLTLPPEPPTAPRIVQTDGGLEVSWDAPALDAAGGDAPTAYRVYLSRDGHGWDEGRDASATSLRIDDSGSAPIYVRVTAVNDGGESFPSDVVGARRAPSGSARVLVVQGYTRLDGGQLLDRSYAPLGTIKRGLLHIINDGSYVARVGAALDASDVSFDSAHADAVAGGAVSLDGYDAVWWILGEESSGDAPLDAAEREVITAYLGGGGKMVVAGAELVWALADQGTDADRDFLATVLHVGYGADDADTYELAATAGGLFDGIAPFTFDDFGPGSFTVEFPDVLVPGPGATEAMAYGGGTGGAAAVWWNDDASGAAVLVTGFPIVVVKGAEVRAEIAARLLDGFGVAPDPYTGDDDDGDGFDDPDDIDDPDLDVAGGCGCQTGGLPGGGAGLVLLGLAAARWRRSRRGQGAVDGTRR